MSETDFAFPDPQAPRPFVITFANEKGGTGKSTLSFHAVVGLLRHGYAVGSIDADWRQGTLSRYLENRASVGGRRAQEVAMPDHIRLRDPAGADDPDGDVASEAACAALRRLAGCDFVVIDTPGSPTAVTRFAIANADTLVSPVNDSYVDIDVLAALNMERREVTGPSRFTQLVWERSNLRVAAGLPPIDWIVLRNRLTHIESRNKRDIADLMVKLAGRIGFRVAPGFGERVIYRELFHTGMTVLDIADDGSGGLSQSQQSARQELSALLGTIGIEETAAVS